MIKKNLILAFGFLLVCTSLLFFLLENRKTSIPKNKIENPAEKQNPTNPPTDETNIDENPFCTMEAKECSDGSYVGRSGPKCEFTKCPEVIAGQKTGWKTYRNYGLGFEISFLDKYKLLDDIENKYGWKNAVALLYSGGQSYNLVISLWDSEQEYKEEYKNMEDRVTIFRIKEKYLVLFNQNKESDIDEAIATFQSF